MDNFSKLQALTGRTDMVNTEATAEPVTAWPKARHIYEGTDSDDDEDDPENVTSGRAAIRAFPSILSQKQVDLAPPAATYTTGDIDYEFEFGQLAPEDEVFCSFQAIKKYPYAYIGGANRKRVDEGFFAQGKLYEHSWDLFYIYRESSDPNQQPILLATTRQFEKFLTTINRKLRTNLSIPAGSKGAFLIQFPIDGTPRPRYLGRVLTKEMAETLKQNVPPNSFKLDNEPYAIEPSEKALTAFRKKMELLHQTQRGKNPGQQQKQKKDRIEKHKHWNDSIKRVQRYLGLRAAKEDHMPKIKASLEGPSLGWLEYDAAIQAAAAKLPPGAAFDPDKQVSFDLDSSVVFVSVDVEAYERNTKQITEIGIAALDTEDIISMTPGKGGKNWMTAIRARHFRIKEHKHLKNTEFVAGCADRFEFGESEFIDLADAPHIVSTCFKHPFSKPGVEAIQQNPKRNIILVGHDVGSDISFLHTAGYDVRNLSNLLEVVDTSTMWKYLKRESNPRKLSSVLAELGITGWNLHNAGNDAVYTLQAMIAIAIKHLEDRQKLRGMKEQENKINSFESSKQATDSIIDKEEGWSSTGNNSDGGVPVLNLPMSKNSQPQQRAGPWDYLETPWLKNGRSQYMPTTSSATELRPTKYQTSNPKSIDQIGTSQPQTLDDVLNSSWDIAHQKSTSSSKFEREPGKISIQHATTFSNNAASTSSKGLAKLEELMMQQTRIAETDQ